MNLSTLAKVIKAVDALNNAINEDGLDEGMLQEILQRCAERSSYRNTHMQFTLVQSAPVTVGCWVTTMWGPAVVTGFEHIGVFVDKPTSDCWVHYRYEAIRDGRTLWVGNSDRLDWVHYLREPDDVSAYVLTLKGPYGDE